jgi:molybdopterin converting factor small subunit
MISLSSGDATLKLLVRVQEAIHQKRVVRGQQLFAAYPGIRDRILTERREIRQHVNVFVGKREARTIDGLATPLANGMEVLILPAISGG